VNFPCRLWCTLLRPFSGKPYGWEVHYVHPKLVLTDYFSHYSPGIEGPEPDAPTPPLTAPEPDAGEDKTTGGPLRPLPGTTFAAAPVPQTGTPRTDEAKFVAYAEDTQEKLEVVTVGTARQLERELVQMTKWRDEARECGQKVDDLLAATQRELAEAKAALENATAETARVRETLHPKLREAQQELDAAKLDGERLREVIAALPEHEHTYEDGFHTVEPHKGGRWLERKAVLAAFDSARAPQGGKEEGK